MCERARGRIQGNVWRENGRAGRVKFHVKMRGGSLSKLNITQIIESNKPEERCISSREVRYFSA
jgi:hypothetical protein